MALTLEEDYYIIKSSNGEYAYSHINNIDTLLVDIIHAYKTGDTINHLATRKGEDIYIYGFTKIHQSEVINILMDFLLIFFSKSCKVKK